MIMKERLERLEGKECRGRELVEHFLGHHKEDHVRHIVHLALTSAILGLAVSTMVHVCRIRHDVRHLEKDLRRK